MLFGFPLLVLSVEVEILAKVAMDTSPPVHLPATI
jgi:hypothetical protein